MAEHQDHDTVSAAAERTESPTELEENGQNIQQGIQDREPDLALLQEGLGALDLDGEAVEDNEPTTRADFLQHSRKLTLDPDTVNPHLLLSNGYRKARVTSELQSYSQNPDRFTKLQQVLSRESLTGRCYWEVEWRGAVEVAVAYKNIIRKGNYDKCGFGENDNSWALRCHEKKYNYRHNGVHTPIPGPQSSRVGVYLDHSAGILSFYSVSETTTLLHRVDHRFTQPLYAGLRLFVPVGDTAELCHLQLAKRIK